MAKYLTAGNVPDFAFYDDLLIAIILSALTLIAIVKAVSKGVQTLLRRSSKSKE